jgi:hypothetical protein
VLGADSLAKAAGNAVKIESSIAAIFLWFIATPRLVIDEGARPAQIDSGHRHILPQTVP